MRARGNIVEIRMESLRFNKEESALLLQRLAGHDLPGATVSSVTEQVDGWAAGLRVAALSLRHNPDVLSGKPSGMPAGSDLMAYLFDEVLMQQPPAIQNFLLRTSILDTLNPDLCEAVVGRENARWNGERCLDYIANNGLFINRIDGGERVYRYHHLFQKLLREQLRQTCSEVEVIALHGRASEWHASRGQPDEALHYAFIVRDYDRARSLVSRFRQPLMNNDEWQRLEHWIEQFPHDVMESSADLLVTEAYIAYMRFRRVECVEVVNRAEALIEAMPVSSQKDALCGEAAALIAHHNMMETVDRVKCEAYAQLALKHAPPDRWMARTMGWICLSAVQLFAGSVTEGMERVYRGLLDARTQGDGFKACLFSLMGFAHAYAGDLSGQLRVANEALKFDDSAGTDRLPSRWVTNLNWARCSKGVAHYFRNELEEAESCLAVVVAQRYQSHVHCVVQSMFALSLAHQAKGRPDDARKLASQAAQYALEMRCTTLIPVTEIFQSQLAVQQGHISEAVHLLGHRELPAVLLPAPFFFAPFMAIVKVCLAEGSESSQARVKAMLARLHAYVEQLHNPRIQMEVLALEALLADGQNDPRAALSILERALLMAQPEGFVRIFADLGPRMADLLSRLHSKKVSPAFIQRIQDAFARPARKASVPMPMIEPLTAREQEVLGLLQKRLSTKEIAVALFITPGTVKRHTHVIYQKLEVHTRREAVLKGEALKLLPLQ